ncbi:hypothetical protein D3C86_1538690 [compost metagenome]
MSPLSPTENDNFLAGTVIPTAPLSIEGEPPAAVEATPAKPAPMTELERLEGNYRALFRRLDTLDQPAGAFQQLRNLADRIQRLDRGFDFTALHLEEGAAPMTDSLPPVAPEPAESCYVCGGLERWKARGNRQPWKCSTCHPPANPEAIERKRLEVEAEGETWDDETAWLIDWLSTAPAPSEPFTLSSGQRVSDPALWLARIRKDAAEGSRGPRARTGALQDDVRVFYRLMNSEAAGALPGSEE